MNNAKSTTRSKLNLTWVFDAQSRTRTKGRVRGSIIAPSATLAASKIRKMGFSNPKVRLDVGQTIKTAAGLLPEKDFNLRDKARLYETLGKRLVRSGSTITSALESAIEYIEDGRLKGAIAIMVNQINDGNSLHQSMIAAGFPQRDAMVVKALSDGGKSAQAFIDLAHEAKTRNQRDAAMASAMRMPKIMFGGFFLTLPAFFLLMGPKMADFFKKIGSQNVNIPESIQAVYAAVDWVNANIFLAAILYVVMGVGLAALWLSPIWNHLAMQIETFKNLSLKTEHASIWSVYGLMYAAAIPPNEICDVLRPTAKLPQTSESLRRMGKHIYGGGDDARAVELAAFPSFVVSGYRAAKESGSVPQGLASFVAMLNEDIDLLTEKTKQWMNLFSIILMALLVLAVFYIVYFPIAGPVLNSL